MKKIPLTQNKFAIVDDEDFEWLNQWKWCFNNGYAVRHQYICRHNGNSKSRRIYMHRLIMNTPEGMEADHINHDELNNSRKNLRNVTASQNNMNRKSVKGSSSQYKGVTFVKRDKKWRANIKVDGKPIHLGIFQTEAEAAKAYDVASQKYHGNFSFKNMVAA